MEKKLKINSRRYLGSKTKLLGFISETIKKENIKFFSFLDLFAGTGSVAHFFNDGKHKIIVNDILESNRCSYNTFFGSEIIDEEKIYKLLNYFNSVEIKEENYFSRNFSDTYFSYSNCIKIGFVRDKIDELFLTKQINKREKDYLITSLIYSADRIANTVGHYDAYRKNGDLSKPLILFPLEVATERINAKNEIYKTDSNELVKNISADVVYIDPPYNSRQYCDAYHLIENIATWNKPEVFGVAKKMDRKNIKSKYCETSAPLVFERLINDIKAKYIIVSYNNTGNKGAGRSQAKISDIDIIRTLEKKGKVTVYETDFNQFTTGKTHIESHKERLFVCDVGHKEKPRGIDVSSFVKSPLNFTGGKFKLLPELIKRFPEEIGCFVDLFGGGFNVGCNIKADKIIYNDISDQTMRVVKLFKEYTTDEIVFNIETLIKKYNLSDTYRNSYDYYGCTSSGGLGSFNKVPFLKLRKDYNECNNSTKKDFLLLLLIIYSFNNQIRFNSSGYYNLPVGKRDFNSSMRKNLKMFSEKMKTQNVYFYSKEFDKVFLDFNENIFVYCDPPYLLGDASYNESGGRNESNEKRLLAYLTALHTKGIKFALSNVIEHKGNKNDLLLKWALDNKFNIIYLNTNYNNSNYQRKFKEKKTVEVLITNY